MSGSGTCRTVRLTATSALIGRQFELEEGERFLAAVENGPVGLVFHGEPGIGKTALVEEILARATARGMLVLHCAPGEGDARLALTALGDLLSEVAPLVGAHLPPPQRRALEIAREPAGPGDVPNQRPDVSGVSLAVPGRRG